MNITKAIEIKEIFYNSGEAPSYSDYREADKLSIEALKEVDALRKVLKGLGNSLLPGETED